MGCAPVRLLLTSNQGSLCVWAVAGTHFLRYRCFEPIHPITTTLQTCGLMITGGAWGSEKDAGCCCRSGRSEARKGWAPTLQSR